jgi:hypothetical protein
MRDEEFATWLINSTSLTSRPCSDAKSRCRRVERNKGNLDTHFIQDEMRSLLHEFTYNHHDELSGKSPPVSIVGDPVTGTASLKNAINLYLKFCQAVPPNFQIQTDDPGETHGTNRNINTTNIPLPIVHDTVRDTVIVLNDSECFKQHFKISKGETGHTYESIIGPYLNNALIVSVQEPYLRIGYQVQNFVRFCETVVRLSSIQEINLITKFNDNAEQLEILNKIGELQQSLSYRNIALNIHINPDIHARAIRIATTKDDGQYFGWTIKIDRGLNFYQKPGTRFGIGVSDFSLRPCDETEVDIFNGKINGDDLNPMKN